MKTFTLVFELGPERDELFIHADQEGIRRLQEHLDALLKGEPHVHLKTPAWGGDELGEEVQRKEDKLLNHVKIFCWHK